MQPKNFGYGEKLAPLSRLESFRIFFSIAATENLEVVQIDIKTAFLTTNHLPIQNTNPEGVVEPGREDNVFLKRKVIYGNKPSTLYLW
jgi:hypothetical protein